MPSFLGGLRRRASNIMEKPNKNNATSNLQSMAEETDDNDGTSSLHSASTSVSNPREAEGVVSETGRRRESIISTGSAGGSLHSTSTSTSGKGKAREKKPSYVERIAQENASTPQLSPWMGMSNMSHMAAPVSKKIRSGSTSSRPSGKAPSSGRTTPQPVAISSARASVESVAASAVSYSGLSIGGQSGTTTSVYPLTPTSPTMNYLTAPPARPPPTGPLPPTPIEFSGPPTAPALIHELASADMDPSLSGIGYPSRNPPPPPGAPPSSFKIQRKTSARNQITPPSAYQRHMRSLSNPGVQPPPPSNPPPAIPVPTTRSQSDPILPSAPVPPPPPPGAPSSSGGNSRFSKYDVTPASIGVVNPNPFRESIPPVITTTPPQPGSSYHKQTMSAASTTSTRSNYNTWVPDITGYYGGNQSFVTQVASDSDGDGEIVGEGGESPKETIARFPTPPSGIPGQSQNPSPSPSPIVAPGEIEFPMPPQHHPAPPHRRPVPTHENVALIDSQSNSLKAIAGTQEERLKAEEDARETSKVLLPNGVLLHASPAPPTTSSSEPPSSSTPIVIDTTPPIPEGQMLISIAEHEALLAQVAELAAARARSVESEKRNCVLFDRIEEWEKYKAEMDKYITLLTADRSSLVEKLNIAAHNQVEKEKQWTIMTNGLKGTIVHLQGNLQNAEVDKQELVAAQARELDMIRLERDEDIRVVKQQKEVELRNLSGAHDETLRRANAVADENLRRFKELSEIARFEREREFEEARRGLLRQVDENATKVQELVLKYGEIDNRRRNLEGLVVEQRADLDDTRHKLADANEIKHAIMMDLKESKRVLFERVQENKRLQEEVNDMLPKIVDLQEKIEYIDKLKEDARSQQKYLETANKEKESLKDQIKNITNARTRLATALRTAEEGCKERDDAIQAHIRENEKMKKKLFAASQRVAEKMEWYQQQAATLIGGTVSATA